jgi:flagellar biosynthesis chaperone FliJ
MKRFVWRLQRVLEIKKKQEQKVRAELFELTERLAQKRGDLLARQKMLENIIDGLAERNPKNRLGEQEFFLRHSDTNDQQIKRLKKDINVLESQQREKVAEVLKVRKSKEGLERLRVEAKMQFIKEQEKLEQKDLDEGATISFVRKSRDWEMTNE